MTVIELGKTIFVSSSKALIPNSFTEFGITIDVRPELANALDSIFTTLFGMLIVFSLLQD